ncbi:MAG: hypothetical protein E6J26_12055 [Chloroflexi bacterium]|nr:MAG: hypothetical protein E6J26_12055 [Chloroflexota bacterium]
MKFSEFAQSLQALEQTRSRKTMTELVASLFRAAAAEEIGQICYLLQGRVAPLFEAVEFGVADRLLVRAISLAYGVSEERVQKAFKRTGDMGSAAELSFDLTQNKLRRRALSVGDVFERCTRWLRRAAPDRRRRRSKDWPSYWLVWTGCPRATSCASRSTNCGWAFRM